LNARRFDWGSSRKVVVGLHRQSELEDVSRRIRVETIIEHEDYESLGSSDHDIMLLKLAEPVEFNEAVSPACIPDVDDIFPEGMRCYTTGWGALRCKY
jgi:hypothetical protein